MLGVTMLQSHADIIAAFGGSSSLARAIGLEPRLTIHWHSRGIPPKYWIAVEDAAADREMVITARLLMATHPKQQKAA